MSTTKFVPGGRYINEDQSEFDSTTDAVRRLYETKQIGPVEALELLVRAGLSNDVNVHPEWAHVDTIAFVLKMVLLVPTDPVVQQVIKVAGTVGKIFAALL